MLQKKCKTVIFIILERIYIFPVLAMVMLTGCNHLMESDEQLYVLESEKMTENTIEAEEIIYSGPTFENENAAGYHGFSYLQEGCMMDERNHENRITIYAPGVEADRFYGYDIDKEYLGVRFQAEIISHTKLSLEDKLDDLLADRFTPFDQAQCRDFVLSKAEPVGKGARAEVEYCKYDSISEQYYSAFHTYYLRELKNGSLALIRIEIRSYNVQENIEELIWELEQFYQFEINWDGEWAQQKIVNCEENNQEHTHVWGGFLFGLPLEWKQDASLGNDYTSLVAYAPEGNAEKAGCMIALHVNFYDDPQKMELIKERFSEVNLEEMFETDISEYKTEVCETILGNTFKVSYAISDEKNSAVATVYVAVCKNGVITIMAMETPGSSHDVDAVVDNILENGLYEYAD